MNNKKDWDAYVAHELEHATPLLAELGFSLNKDQPHLGGERYLMQAITSTSGPKLILIGKRDRDNLQVVIKITTDASGTKEIEHERRCRATLNEIEFAYERFYAPEEVAFTETRGVTVSIQEYIEQESTFLERPIEKQFDLALTGLKIQESAHATTYGHLKRISTVFPRWNAQTYLNAARTLDASETTLKILTEGAQRIEQYTDFLTHSDYVPHNIRVRDHTLYLLDHSSIRFGNKHEGWARFINFMVLYNPPLAKALQQYVKDNRAPEESESLRLMRIFRLIEIIAYYRGTLVRSEGDLHTLNTTRVTFWNAVLESVLKNTTLDSSVRDEYIRTRDSLRSADEKKRQTNLH
ncbi:MAG: hypothetical protein ACE5F4_01815 [Candidatus Paceibacteria bacterium]